MMVLLRRALLRTSVQSGLLAAQCPLCRMVILLTATLTCSFVLPTFCCS